MKKYLRPKMEEIEIKVTDIITSSGIYQSPDKPKSAIGTDITDGADVGNINPADVF